MSVLEFWRNQDLKRRAYSSPNLERNKKMELECLAPRGKSPRVLETRKHRTEAREMQIDPNPTGAEEISPVPAKTVCNIQCKTVIAEDDSSGQSKSHVKCKAVI